MTGAGAGAAPAARTILHLDMDAFFVACELRRRPDLAGLPVVVGGTGERGVVAAASYEARRYGIHSAMPSVRARRLCPRAVFLPGDHAHYAAVSRDVHRILEEVTPLVEPIALDEAFLDVTGVGRLHGTGPDIAWRLRRRIADDLGLSASVGVAPSKLLAKLASEAAKPKATRTGVVPGRGVVVVAPGEELAFLQPHPVEALWGVGPATSARLRRLGVTTVGDLAGLPVASLVAALGEAHGTHLAALARGDDPRPVQPDRAPKSVGHEETFAHDLHDRGDCERELVRLADATAGRLRAAGLSARTVTVKVRFADFRTITRTSTLPAAVVTGPALARAALGLLAAVDVSAGVRLLGLSATHLAAADDRAPQQLRFDDAIGPGSAPAEPWIGASRAVDEIRRRFGADAIGPAALAPGGRLRVARRGGGPWGPDTPVGAQDPDVGGR